MATAGSIVVDLLARTGSFETDMQRAARTADAEAKKIAKSAKDNAQETEVAWTSASKAIGIAIGAISVGAVFARLTQNTINAANEQAQLAAVLRSTGEAAGWSAASLNEMAATMSRASTVSAGEINNAQTTLLAFTGIVGDQFTQALQFAIDMSARTGMSVVSAAETIGRALDVPSQGLAALSRQGFKFGPEQKALAEQLEATGRTAEAQGIVLDALRASYEGAGLAARNTLGGALAALTNTIDDLLTASNGAFGPIVDGINAMNNLLASGHAETALKAISLAAVAVAVVFSGRLIGSVVGSAAAFTAATAEAARYQAALARMAGVAPVAATAIGGLAAAARAGSIALGILGGPVGLIATLGLTAAAFVTMGGSATGAATDVDTLSQSLNTLNREQLALRQQQADDLFERLSREAADAANALQSVEKDYAALYQRMEQGRGVTPEELQSVNRTLVELRAELADANQKVEQARELQDRLATSARNAAGGVQTLNEALVGTNEAGRRYLDNLVSSSVTAGLKTRRQQLEALVKAGELLFSESDLKKARDAADTYDKATASTKGLTAGLSAAKKATEELARWQERIAEQQEIGAALRMYGLEIDRLVPAERELLKLQGQMGLAVKDRVGKLSDASLKAQIALATETAEYERQNRAIRQNLEQRQQYVNSILDQNAAIYTSVLELQDRAATWAVTDEQTALNVEALTRARVQERIATEEAILARQVLNGASAEEIKNTQELLNGLRTQLEYREQEAKVNATLRQQARDREAFDRTVASWTDTVREIDDVFRKGFADMVNAGEGAWKAFTKSLATTFKTTVADALYKAFAQPFVVRVVAQMAGLISGQGVAQQVLQQSGATAGAGGITDLFKGANLLGGGSIASTVTGYLDSLGFRMIGEGATELGTSLVNSAQWVGKAADYAGQVFGYGKAIYDITKGNYGSAIGTAVGTYILPGIGTAIGSMLGSLVDGMFGKGETRFGGGYTPDAAGNYFRSGGPSGGDPAAAQTAATVQGVRDAVRELAVQFGGNASGLNLAAGWELSPDKGNSFVFSDWARAGQDMSWERGLRSLEGVKDGETVAAEFATELQRALIRGLQMSDLERAYADIVNAVDVGSLDEAGVQSVMAALAGLQEFVALLGATPWVPAAAATANFAAALTEATGSAEEAATLLASAYQNYWSEAERVEHVTTLVTQGFAALGMEVPKTRAEMQDLLTANMALGEGGAKTVAALLNLGDGLDIVLTASEAAAEALKQVNDAREQERLGLEGRILQLEGNTVELRRRELAALDPANQALQTYIWHLEDEKVARDALLTAQTAMRDEIESLAAGYNDIIDPAGKAARSQQSLVAGFEALGLQMPETRAGFHSIVESFRLAGPEFDDTYLALLRLTPAFADYVTNLDDMAEATKASAKVFADAQQSARDSIAQSIGGLQERIILDQLGTDSARHGYYDAQFQTYAGLAGSLNDPAAIADAVSKAMAAASNAYGLLDEAGRAANNDAYLKTLSQLQERSNEAVERANKDAAEQQGKVLVGLLKPVMDETIRAIRQAVTNSDDGSRNVTRAIETLEDNLIEAVSRSGRHALEVTG